ncbi:MAG: hypothetical protein J6A55_04730 [Oscillospiraceae bacterium]|nr:hypothetical protein [Oscillospiraceae bacterium]
MKILFILGAYKPRASANGLCSSNIIECLKNEGHSVTVLANHSLDCTDYTLEDGVAIYRVRQRIYIRLREYSEVISKSKPLAGRVAACLANIINKLKLILSAPFWPIISYRTNKRFSKKAKELQKCNDYDVVVSVYTPIEALLAGYEVKKEFPQVKFIPYFLDSLSGGYGPRLFSEKRIMERGLKIEKKIYEVADAIVLMKSSEEHQKKYNCQYVSKMKFLDIPMFVKPKNIELRCPTEDKLKCCKMLFVGSIARSIRSPKTLIDALMCIKREDIICEFVGNIDCIDDFAPLKEKMGNRLVFTTFMHHDKLVEKIVDADVLINIGNRLTTMVPSKIFEYMSYLKPIISTYDIENEPSAIYLSAYPASLLISGSAAAEDNALMIMEFIQRVEKMEIDYDEIEERFYLNTPKAFDEVIDSL